MLPPPPLPQLQQMMKLRNDVNFEKFVGLKNIFLAEVDSDSSHQGAKVCSKYYDK